MREAKENEKIVLINGDELCTPSVAQFIGNMNRGGIMNSTFDGVLKSPKYSRYIKKIYVKRQSRGLYEVAYTDENNRRVMLYQGDAAQIPETLKDPRAIHVEEITYTHLEFWRKKRGLTLEQLAERAGISINSISRFENCTRDISNASADTVKRLARALDVSMEELLSDWK